MDGERGHPSAAQVTAAIDKGSPYVAPTRLLCIEQTHNFGGGTVWPLDRLRASCDVAHEAGLATHLDGARLMNAVVASGVAAREFCAPCDSAWLDLSKGLGAPVGGVLAGSAAFIAEARRYKHIFGGAMRQAGIIAAAGVYALEHHVARLADDHEHARRLAAGLGDIPGVTVENPEPGDEHHLLRHRRDRHQTRRFPRSNQGARRADGRDGADAAPRGDPPGNRCG